MLSSSCTRVSRPSATPATVACTPLASTAYQAPSGQRQVHPAAPGARALQDPVDGDQGGAGQQHEQVQVVGVEDGDDGDGAEVVDDRAGQQERPQRPGASSWPVTASTASAKAMSVAVGIAQPRAASGVAQLTAR